MGAPSDDAPDLDPGDDWVIAMRTTRAGVADVEDALDRADIDSHTLARGGAKDGRSMTVYVHARDAVRARELLARHLETGEERLRPLIRRLQGQILVAVGVVLGALGFVALLATRSPRTLWVILPAIALLLLGLRRLRPAQDEGSSSGD